MRAELACDMRASRWLLRKLILIKVVTSDVFRRGLGLFQGQEGGYHGLGRILAVLRCLALLLLLAAGKIV